jgi:4-amino-4-deoxy-L-arabinose transferase-like glycosyltransferase
MKKIDKKNSLLILLVICSAILRLINLGYSDYQGDETQALYNPKGQSFTQFIFSQRRAPIQFVITMFIRGISDNYHNEFITRLPFALFSIASSYVFYIFVKKLVNEKVAFYSLIFFITNGFFVSFGRMVQYQSLVILLMLLVLYQLLLLSETSNIKHLYFAGILWGFSFLVHSDSVYFFPMALLLLIEWLRKNNMSFKTAVKKLLPPLILGIGVLAVFYVPYLLNLPSDTLNYWKGRVEGTHQPNVVSNSKYLFEVYQPIYVSHLYIFSSLVGIVLLLKSGKEISKERRIGLILWFLFSYLFMEYAIEVPGTHIYNYIIPAFIFMGIFFSVLDEFVIHRLKKIYPVFLSVVVVMFLFLFLQSYAIFVDHEREYPWQTEKFLAWDFPSLNPVFKLSLFGFPYYRDWEGISDFIVKDGKSTFYATNEKQSIPRYYLPDGYVNDNYLAGYYIRVRDPQSGTNPVLNERCAKWIEKNDPIKVFYSGDKVLAEIYFIPEDWK